MVVAIGAQQSQQQQSQGMGGQSQTIAKSVIGLFNQHNILNLPRGALARAENCAIDREDVLSNRRGFQRYGQALTVPATNLMYYLNRLVFLDGATIKYDSDGLGTWGIWAGTFVQPTAMNRIRFIEENSNFYFTTERGVFKNDSLTGTPVRAGMPQGLDIFTTLTGTGVDSFPVDSQVGYRVVFGREDANKNILLGSPSFRVTQVNIVTSVTLVNAAGTITVTHTAHGYTTGDTIQVSDLSDAGFGNSQHIIIVTGPDTYTYTDGLSNPGATSTGKAGKQFSILLTITVPQGVDLKAGDFWELYRTNASASASVDPGDRHFKVLRKTLSASDITSGQVTFTDTFSDSFLGEPLYTNDTEETIAQTNDRPPWAKYVAVYKDHVFYGNILREHQVEIQLLTVANMTAEVSTITVGSRVYTASTTEAQGKFRLYKTETTGALNVQKTMRSLAKAVNLDTGNSLFQAFYSSLFDDAPGKVLLKARALNGSSFTVTSSVPNDFTPVLPLVSEAPTHKNFLGRSKFERPEAVPIENTDKIGPDTREITGLALVKDGLIVATEAGLWILSGESDGGGGFNFVVNPLDPAVDVTTPASVVSLDSSMYAFTSQGLVRAVAGGSSIVSRQIERLLKQVSMFPQFKSISHACEYESDRKYIFAIPETKGDSYPKIIVTWNYLTMAWTIWRKPILSMVVIPVPVDRLFMAHAEDPYILIERKDLTPTNEDFVDENITDTITAVGTSADGLYRTVNVTHTYSAPLAAGWLFQQGSVTAKVTGVSSLGGNSYQLTLDSLPTVSVTTCDLGIPISMKVEWMPDDGGNAAVLKDFTVCQFKMETNDALTTKIGFWSDTQQAAEYVGSVVLARQQGWGTNPWGSTAWGDNISGRFSTPLRVFIPRNHRQCTSLRVLFEHSAAREAVNILEMALDARAISTMTARRT